MGAAVPVGDLARNVASIRQELDAAIADVLDRGWFVLGPELEAFEQEFAAFCGTRHAVGVGSGADALALALAALGIGPGDEVVTVANACTYQLDAIEHVGARPVFADVDDDHVADPESVVAAITPRTRAIVPVHLYGRLAPMSQLRDLAADAGVAVVEDAAQAHGAWALDPRTANPRHAGAWGDVGCFSFYPSKNLGAFGDGGAVTTDSDSLAAELKRLRMYGWESKYVRARSGGRNSRLDEMQAAILRVKLRHLDEWNQARRERAAWYRELVEPETVGLPSDVNGHVYHLFVVTTDRRDELRAGLSARSIGSDVHYPVPCHLQAGTRAAFGSPLPNTERLARQVCSVPMFPELTRDEVEIVARAINEVMGAPANHASVSRR